MEANRAGIPALNAFSTSTLMASEANRAGIPVEKTYGVKVVGDSRNLNQIWYVYYSDTYQIPGVLPENIARKAETVKYGHSPSDRVLSSFPRKSFFIFWLPECWRVKYLRRSQILVVVSSPQPISEFFLRIFEGKSTQNIWVDTRKL